jgi:hypothetical protein
VAPSTAPETPPAPVEPVVPALPSPPPNATPVSVPADRLATAALTRLLQTKRSKALELPPPLPPSEFSGPDSELLRIQDEILYLALDALRKPPE